MQNAELVLSMLNQKSQQDKNFKFRRLYRNLFNTDFYLNAYAKMSSKEGNMTKGVDEKTIDGFSITKVNNLIEQIQYERFQPQSVQRKYIPKKDGKQRPLGIPTFEDKLIQEILRQILEAIYEPLFNKNSHGFRPGKSCHTALYQIKRKCNGRAWIIEGDIKGFFDNINHDILINILKQKIDDGRIINLINKFLKAGIMEEGNIRNSLTGTPQGGIISPLLANIYLNELDNYMEKLQVNYNKGDKRKTNKEYHRLACARYECKKKGNIEKAEAIRKQMIKLPSTDPMDFDYIRVKYVRYADDFVILLHSPKSLAVEIKNKVALFLKSQLQLELNMDKTLITNLLKDKARFLGYEITKAKCDQKIKKIKNGTKARIANGVLQLLVPADVINNKIRKYTKNGKPVHINDRINLDIKNLLTKYNAEIRGLYNYYRLATNVSKRLGKFKYYHYYSLVKTLARKHKVSVKKTIGKFGMPAKRKQGTGTINIIGTHYQTKAGNKTLIYFNESLKRINIPITSLDIPGNYKINFKNELIRRLINKRCELCENQFSINELEVHHIRNLKKLNNAADKKKENTPYWIKLMLKIRRKTLIVCKSCHNNIHKTKGFSKG